MILKRQEYINKIIPLIDKDVIKVITGIRRSGKSIMLNQIIEEIKSRGIDEDHILIINFDSADFQDMTRKTLNQYVKNFIKDKEKYYLFFDEIQNVEEWELSLVGFIVDFNVDIYITGSNANLLSGELATHLTGRYMEFKLYPFSFKEIVELDKITGKNTETQQLFLKYIKEGGMPYTYQLDDENKYQYLEDVYNSIVFKDVLKRSNIKNVDLLDRLIRFMMTNTSQTFSASSISKYFKNEKRTVKSETIYNYLKCFENACFIHRVLRQDVVGKKILKFNEKFFLTDHGFRQAICGHNLRDIQQILENIVYIELLRRGYEVTVGKLYNTEIDFICKKREEKIYIQVTYMLADEKTKEKEFKPLLKIKDSYPKYVLSMDPLEYNIEGIEKKNIMNFLLE